MKIPDISVQSDKDKGRGISYWILTFISEDLFDRKQHDNKPLSMHAIEVSPKFFWLNQAN